ncbi:hypothetical protein PG985_008965 [Apiospora marii]|uniref:Aminoglycoside phosphotransferase domain-containing protein n=1 Tax=Apiospora marii TaxID=335849 RepID=A0ABR1RB52_9PEZI
MKQPITDEPSLIIKPRPRKLRTSICSIDSQKFVPCDESEVATPTKEETIDRITALCKQLWPSVEDGTIHVQYLDEGTYNQVFVISCADFAGQLPDMVLRLPWDGGSITRTVSILEYLDRYTELKVPKVIHWDASKDNALGHDYVIMTRIPGRALQSVYGDLSHEQKIIVAKQVAQLYRQMEAITSPIAGRIKAHGELSPGEDASNNVFIQPFGTEWLEVADNPVDWDNKENGILPIGRLRYDPPGLSINEIMIPIYQRRIYSSLNRPTPFDWNMDLFEPLQEMVQGMVDNELFKPENDHICLQHPDFFPRNIMVDFAPDPVVTGIIDWDDANFSPRFATCIPPRWLWQPDWAKNTDNEDEEDADDGENEENQDDDDECEDCNGHYEGNAEPLDAEGNEPSTPEDAEIKKVFEDAVGERWVWEATSPWFPLARRLLQFSRRILTTQQDEDDAAEWKRRWDALFPKDGVPEHTMESENDNDNV